MKAADPNKAHKISNSRWLHAIVFTVAMISFGANSENARAAAPKPTDYRFTAAGDKFEDTLQVAVAFHVRPPRRLRARRLELAIGSLSTSRDHSAFVSLGPVWRLALHDRPVFVELGISPTLIVGGSSFNGRDLGGNVHFTSSLAVGANFGRLDTASVSLRVQHTSNAGLSNTNPGMDMVGINFAFNFANQ